jgi:hypothetical protein
MFKNAKPYPLLLLAIAFAGQVLAAGDPTLSQVYQAARAGRVTQAQQMMQQVLRDHPGSAKAHYVAAELDARRGDRATARQELNTAEALRPGLPFVNAASIQALRSELSQAQAARAPSAFDSRAHSSSPWGLVVLVVAGIGVLWLVLRRRSSLATSQYQQQYSGAMPSPPGAPGNAAGAGVAPNVGAASGIAGGLASGLAVGAGVVAGEEIAHHLLDSGRHEGSAPPAAKQSIDNPENNDLGGTDFGASDGSSWDDDAGGPDDDDWT